MAEERERSADDDALARAQQVIAGQDAEIRRLRQQLTANRFADELRQSLTLAGTAERIAAPVAYTQLLILILETAQYLINSTTASISLVDEERGELVIQHALGPGAREAEGLHFALGHGIAGLVAASGQPMVISNARSDPRHAADIAEKTGYHPDTILSVPLLQDERVLGVMQLMDKASGRSFTTADIETVGLLGAQAAIVVDQARLSSSLATLVGRLLPPTAQAETGAVAADAARAFSAALQDAPDYHETLELARLVQQVASHGEQERQLCIALLQSLAGYFAARPQAGFGRMG